MGRPDLPLTLGGPSLPRLSAPDAERGARVGLEAQRVDVAPAVVADAEAAGIDSTQGRSHRVELAALHLIEDVDLCKMGGAKAVTVATEQEGS